MPDEISNDNQHFATTPLLGADPAGHAALLLVESLIHALVARKLISVEDAVEIVAVAAEVNSEIGEELGDTPHSLSRSLAILEAINASLSRDVGK